MIYDKEIGKINSKLGRGSVGTGGMSSASTGGPILEKDKVEEEKKKDKINKEKSKEVGDKLGVDWGEVDLDQFVMGMNVELEHGSITPEYDVTHDDLMKTGKIALAHLGEDSEYYSKLKSLKLEEDRYDNVNDGNGIKEDGEEEVLEEMNFLLGGVKVVILNLPYEDLLKRQYVEGVKEVYRLLKAKNLLSKVWYGNLFILSTRAYELSKEEQVSYRSGGMNISTKFGDYTYESDMVRVWGSPLKIRDIILHELGHRYWYKHMTKGERGKYKDLVDVYDKSKPILKSEEIEKSKELISKYFEIMRLYSRDMDPSIKKNQGWSIEWSQNRLGNKIEKYVETVIKIEKSILAFFKELFPLHNDAIRKQLKEFGIVNNLKTNFYNFKIFLFDSVDEIRKFVSIKEGIEDKKKYYEVWSKHVEDYLLELEVDLMNYIEILENNSFRSRVMKGNEVPAVSEYGKENEAEAFAEIFLHYVLGKDMSRDQLDSFKAVMNLQESRKKIDFNEFKRTDNIADQYKMLKNNFETLFLGRGSSRHVFNIGNGKAIKFGMNLAGVAQNREEYKIYKKNKGATIMPKIYDASPTFQWLMVELVKPLDYKEKYYVEKKLGISFDDFILIGLRYLKKGFSLEELEQSFEDFNLLSLEQKRNIINIFDQIEKAGISYKDMGGLSQWGINSNGDLVLLDYGASEEVLQKHYDVPGFDSIRTFQDLKDLKESRKKIDFNEFKRADNIKDQYNILKSNSRELFLGKGSSRHVFNIGNGKAIKFAVNKAGIVQNKEEYKIYKKNKNIDIIPKIYDASPTFQWLMVELVKPLTYNDDSIIRKKLGINFNTLVVIFDDVLYYNYNIDTVLGSSDRFQNLTEQQKSNIKNIIEGIKKINMPFVEVQLLKQWGLNSNGDLVLLDFGATEEILDKYYSNNRTRNTKVLSDLDLNESRKFLDINKVKSIEDDKELEDYLFKNGKIIGKGSSRVVFFVNSRVVLKYAYNTKGIEQNLVELKLYSKPKNKNILAKIYEIDKKGRWIISEIVRPLSDNKEFGDLLGMSFITFKYILDAMMDKKENNVDEILSMKGLMNLLNNVNSKWKYTTGVNKEFIESIYNLYNDNKMGGGDLLRIDHYGKTIDGRVVLLDYGLTSRIYNKFYKTNKRGNKYSSGKENLFKNDLEEAMNQNNDGNLTLQQILNLNMIDRKNYLRKKAKYLGGGHGREVYQLNDNMVLKIAANEDGKRQNKNEFEASKVPSAKGLVTPIYKIDEQNFEWMISMLVTPIKTDEEFESVAGVSQEDFDLIFPFDLKSGTYSLQEPTNDIHPLLKALYQFVKDTGLSITDLQKLDSWGKTKNGKIILLDYGDIK